MTSHSFEVAARFPGKLSCSVELLAYLCRSGRRVQLTGGHRVTVQSIGSCSFVSRSTYIVMFSHAIIACREADCK